MDLKALWEERQQDKVFKERDQAYKLFDHYYHARDPEDAGKPQLTYRPYLVDGVQSGSEDSKFVINQVRRTNNHFASMFARAPKTWVLPFDEDQTSVDSADIWTAHLDSVFRRSKLGMQQPRQSFWLSNRGDACWGVDWDGNGEGGEVLVRCFDPAWCYPAFSDMDLGGVENILITFQVHPRWAKEHYKIAVKEDEMARVFIFWNASERIVQVNDREVKDFHRQHDLGFCPFRWVFGGPDGSMAQADCREIPPLQDLFNENLLLALDSIRKTVDPAYYAVGLKPGTYTPQAGQVMPLPDGASVGQFPTGGDAHMILGVMNQLEGYITGISGISPISATGQAHGSIVTGSAVRHQVEAAESRAETRKTALEAAYAQIGGMILRITERKLSEIEIPVRVRTKLERVKGDAVGGWYECEAQYGGYFSLPVDQRVRAAMEGLGRLWDDRFALTLADVPGVVPGDMTSRLRDYQLRQATATGQAQALGQMAAQEAQQAAGGQLPGMQQQGGAPPQPQQGPPKPSPQQLQQAIGG